MVITTNDFQHTDHIFIHTVLTEKADQSFLDIRNQFIEGLNSMNGFDNVRHIISFEMFK
ncbi:Uncharacterised protein [Streptococcus pneumoniae]|nr:Uncharacterised protein [Streptococcus pneumoniae]